MSSQGEGRHPTDSVDMHTGTSQLLPLSGQTTVGRLSPQQVGTPAGKEACLCRGAGPQHGTRLRMKLHTDEPHTQWADVSSQEGCHFVLVWKESPHSRGQVVDALPGCILGPPTTGHGMCALPARSTAEGTILPLFLGKVTLEASTQMPAALGAEAHF